ncbi:uncharacterized protein LOC131618414 [Vicia villosa]|uniref:uncharacterized protein LOC131618414 n=1 Tax=Vicia villosa TaxID=3911 RepID=UPI00273B072E|nr:uncharacterized protein LOC131618414 [Vicia villosa]
MIKEFIQHQTLVTFGIIDDRQDRLRHDKVAQHASVRRERSQASHASIGSNSFVTSSPLIAEASTSKASTSRESTYRAHASLATSSCRRQVLPTNAQETPEAPQEASEASTPEVLQGFGGGPSDLSLLPLYPDHTAIHVWDGEVNHEN